VRTYLDCLPCFVRQALEAARFVTSDEATQAEVLRQVLRAASELDFRSPPPTMGRHIHQLIRRVTGNADPYHEVKCRFNRLAMDLLPDLRTRVAGSATPFETAVRLAIAGNIIDFGVTASLDEKTVTDTINRALARPLVGNPADLRRAADRAERILYLADNAGEIVFDRLLIEALPPERVTVVVKGKPVINDATLEDAEAAGLTDRWEVVDNGSDAPGTILETCSPAFRRRFEEADLIIAKGQGNYETLSDVNRPVFFVLMAKCPVVAGHIGCRVGDLVVRRGGGPRPGRRATPEDEGIPGAGR